jgi:Gpi18-like mannosyltransferase
MRLAGPLRAVGSVARWLISRTLEVYGGSPFNLLDYLASCTDAAFVGWIALTRLSLLLLMWISRSIAPVVFRAPGNSFIFDTGEELYDDDRFAMVRQWDGVHMFFIAHYGYLYENQIVFFPGLPALIRAVQYVTHRAVPQLRQLAPVSFYICVLNMAASCVAGVLLRRLATLTFLGPEAVRKTCRWCSSNAVAASATRAATASDADNTTEAVIRYRLLCGLTGTSLDIADPLAPLPTTTKEVRAALRRRRRVIGATALLWIFTPAMVFTVAVYTESLFALTTILGIYWLAWYEPFPVALQERMANWLPVPSPGTPRLHQGRSTESNVDGGVGDSPEPSATRRVEEDAVDPSLKELLADLTGGAQNWPTVVWKQALLTRAEVVAVLLFTLAATLRSNAFTCAGFLAFPVVVQLFLPALHAAQCRTTLAGQHAAAILAAAPPTREQDTVPSQRSSKAVKQADPASSSSSSNSRDTHQVVCFTLSCPQQRLPHPLRLLVIFLECAVLLAPYLTINYIGYCRFVTHMWKPAAQAQIGGAFWRLYPMLQQKYWNVSFLSAYTFTNFPNVVLALPVAVLVARCTNTWYLAPAWEARALCVAATSNTKSPAQTVVAASSGWTRLGATLTPLIRSSNVVHLLALLTLALSKMNVQVTNRFVMFSPALYFLLGAQLAGRPTSYLSQLILMWSILWSIMGGTLFANHLPWT